MLERITRGDIPRKPHTAHRTSDGQLYHEHCLTKTGFDGPFTIVYHQRRPHAFETFIPKQSGMPLEPASETIDSLRRRHFPRTPDSPGGDSLGSRQGLLFNEDVLVATAQPTVSDASYFLNANADVLLYVQQGEGTLLSPLGTLGFSAKDYVYIPKGLSYRFELSGTGHDWLWLEFAPSLGLPQGFRNPVGQLRMDAPFSHRDFRKPEFNGPIDEGLREVLVQKDQHLYGLRYKESPLDVVGFDGSVYPFAFSIRDFHPRVGRVHLPPTSHGTFCSENVLVCSFVPRQLDFDANAIPCPYPHSSVDVDEVLFYSDGQFGSRKGVGLGSITLHPRGIPHGPHPGRYEQSIGQTSTDELAVMLDCFKPLTVSQTAFAAEDSSYDESFSS